MTVDVGEAVVAALEAAGEAFVLETEQGEAKLKFSTLSDARLVLTDKLIAEDLKRAKAAEAAGAERSDEEEAS